MNPVFAEEAWEDYCNWQKHDKKLLMRINELIKDIKRNGYEGIGKPELLKHNLTGFWSRRINAEHRLVYTLEDDAVLLAQCRYHY